MDVKSVNDHVYNAEKIRKLKENAQKKIERYLTQTTAPRNLATVAPAPVVEPVRHACYSNCKMEEIRRIKEEAKMKMSRYRVGGSSDVRPGPPIRRSGRGQAAHLWEEKEEVLGEGGGAGLRAISQATLADVGNSKAPSRGHQAGAKDGSMPRSANCNQPLADPGEEEKVCRLEKPSQRGPLPFGEVVADPGQPVEIRSRDGGATFYSASEEKLPWLADTGPPAKAGDRFPNGSTVPATTIQPDMLRNVEAVGLQESLQLKESPVLAEVASPPPRPAFVRAGIEQARAILYCLGDSGNLVEADVMSMKTFKDLNQYARPRFELEAYQGKIHAVNGKELDAVGKIRGGLSLQLEGAHSSLRVYPVVCSDFKGNHLNISQGTLADNTISYHPTPSGGAWGMPDGSSVPLVPKQPPLYSVKYNDDLLRRISIFRLKQKFLSERERCGKPLTLGEMARRTKGDEEELGLKALAAENRILRGATQRQPVALTGDGFLAREPGLASQPEGKYVTRQPFEDAFVGHEDLRGLTIEELEAKFAGEDREVSHLRHLSPGRPVFLAPQVGRLTQELKLASGEARTVTVRASLPPHSYVHAEPMNEEDDASPDYLKGCQLAPSVTLCFNGKTALVVLTNGSIGPVTLSANTPVCKLRVVRPEFERQVQEKQDIATPAQDYGAKDTLGRQKRIRGGAGDPDGTPFTQGRGGDGKKRGEGQRGEDGLRCEGMARDSAGKEGAATQGGKDGEEEEGPRSSQPRRVKGKFSIEHAMRVPWTQERWRFGRLMAEDEEASEDEGEEEKIVRLEDMSHAQRRERLALDLKLATNSILAEAHPKYLERLTEMVANYHHIFTDGQTYNHINLPACPFVQCRVVLDPNKGPHVPYRATPRPMSPIQRKGLRDKIEQWRKQGVIEPSASPWCFPLVAVEKKRRPGQQFPEYRYCSDLRKLNDVVLKDSCFSGSVPANLALLEGHNFYSAMDLYSSFESCEIAPESRDFFSFNGADGEQWRMKRLSMGFCNSPSIMARVTSMILQGLPTSSRHAEEELGLEPRRGRGRKLKDLEEDSQSSPDPRLATHSQAGCGPGMRQEPDPKLVIHSQAGGSQPKDVPEEMVKGNPDDGGLKAGEASQLAVLSRSPDSSQPQSGPWMKGKSVRGEKSGQGRPAVRQESAVPAVKQGPAVPGLEKSGQGRPAVRQESAVPAVKQGPAVPGLKASPDGGCQPVRHQMGYPGEFTGSTGGAIGSDRWERTRKGTGDGVRQAVLKTKRGRPNQKAPFNPKLVDGGALGYIDDILTYADTLEGMLDWLEEIFGRISKARCRLKTSKVFLVQREVDYLGFRVGREGRRMQPSYRESVVQWPVPQRRTELSSFLGRTNYYREFIKDFSHLTHSLNQAKARSEAGWKLSEEETQDFHRLQSAFTTSEALSFPCFKDLKAHPFILDLDFSQKGLSASLHQRQRCNDGEWREKLIGNVSRKAPSVLAVASSHRGEVAAAIMGVEHFRHLLLLGEFVLRSDSLSVRFLKNLKDLRGCFPRYYEILSHFRFHAVHRAGNLNGQDDHTSRAEHILPEMTEEELGVHLPPTVGEVSIGWTDQQAEMVARWESRDEMVGESWPRGRLGLTPPEVLSSRWDHIQKREPNRIWEDHPMLGHLNTIIDEGEEDYSPIGEATEEDEWRGGGRGVERRQRRGEEEEEWVTSNGGEVDSRAGESGVAEKEGEAIAPAGPALVGAGIERAREGGLKEQEWDQWITPPSSSGPPITSFFAQDLAPGATDVSHLDRKWIVGWSRNDMMRMQKEDGNLSIVRQWVVDGKGGPTRVQMRQARADRELWCYRQLLHLICLEGELMVVKRMRGQMTRSHRLLIPRQARLRLVAAAHQQYCKHQGVDATLWSLHTSTHWPGQTRDVTDFVSTCGSCWSKRYPPAKHRMYERFTRTAGYVGQVTAADLIGPLPPSPEGFKFCLTAMDLWSRYLYLVPLKSKKMEEVAEGFEWSVVAKAGGVDAVFTDRGKEWLNKTFAGLCERLAIRHTYTLPYTPTANGALERFHRLLKTLVRACLRAGTHEGWVSVARGVVAAYNTTVNPNTGLTPFFLVHGRECTLPLTHFVVPPSQPPKRLEARDRWVQLGQQMTLYFLQHRLGMEVVQRRMSHQGAGTHPLYPLHRHVGTEVVACLPAVTRKHSKTFAPRYLGPYFIVEAVSNVVATIRSDFYSRVGRQEQEHTVGLDRLWPVEPGTRWDDEGVNLPAETYPPSLEQKQQEWASIDLHGEVLRGSGAERELARLNQGTSELDQSWEISWHQGEGEDIDGPEENIEEEETPEEHAPGDRRAGNGDMIGVGRGGGGTLDLVPDIWPIGQPIGVVAQDDEMVEEEVERDIDGQKVVRRRRRSRSRSIVSIGSTAGFRPTTYFEPATPPSKPADGWQPTPPRPEGRQEGSQLGDPQEGVPEGSQLGDHPELEDQSGGPAGGPNQETDPGDQPATPQRNSQEEEEGLSPGALQEGAAQVLRALGAGAEQNISSSDLEDRSRTPTRPSRSRILPERTARKEADKVFADPFTRGLLWGKEKTLKRKKKQ